MKRTDAEIIRDIQKIECQLSPENISWDGERSKTDIAKARKELNVKRKELVNELGREPTPNELYGR